ncbi:MAG: DNA repair protein RecN [Bacteroidia bacterium]|nr:DNA repair protein RecN [Bacteroidia bacterium]MCZ2277082.1 DNA repair protein RecN [Bacteroidia bacterium]
MLCNLAVSNYALIEKLEVDFSRGLTIITGETGAGKSILIGALGMILGNRADTSVLLNKSVKCIIEGEFDLSQYPLQSFFQNNNLDYDSHSVIRREISPEGKSRAFINDTPVTLSVLKAFTSCLIDIHSQHESLTLNDSSFQTEVLDLFGENEKAALLFGKRFRLWEEKKHRLLHLQEVAARSLAESDYLRFQFNELDEAEIQPDELKTLEEEASMLSHAQLIKESASTAVQSLSESENSILSHLNSITSLLKSASRFNKPIEDAGIRLMAAAVELKDLVAELELIAERTEMNPERLQQIEQRLDLLNRLMQKHRLTDSNLLTDKKEEIRNKLESFENTDSEILQLKSEIENEEGDLLKAAERISNRRKEAAIKLENELVKMFPSLGLPQATIQIEVNPLNKQEMNYTGIDRIRFLFSANKGISPAELNKVASGGELSRLMLCLKALIAHKKALPTIIFDEIDTGISGETAMKVGSIIREISKNIQVIAITHLPQMAGKGDSHYHIYKETKGKIPATRIFKLNREERIREIARMLTGDHITEAGLKNARELLI